MFKRHTNTSEKQDELAHQCLIDIQITSVKQDELAHQCFKRHSNTSGKQDELAHQCLKDIQALVENKMNWLINV